MSQHNHEHHQHHQHHEGSCTCSCHENHDHHDHHHEGTCTCSCHENHEKHEHHNHNEGACTCSCHENHENHEHHHHHEGSCTCSCHENHEQQQQEHNEHHCHDPHCSCHSNENSSERDKEAQKLLDNAVILTITEEYPSNCDLNTSVTFVKEGLATLGECFSINRAIMGHIKALLSTSTGNLLISMTKMDDYTLTVKGVWPPEKQEPIQLTVNAHSIFHNGTLSKEEMTSLFQYAEK